MDLYKFDFDENNILALTEENVRRIKFIIANDSNYRIFEDVNNKNSVSCLIRNNSDATQWDKNFLLKIITEIDKYNSTHQESTGIKKGSNGGRERTAQFIYERWSKLLPMIQKGDAEAVNVIATALLNYDPGTEEKPEDKGRYTFSFASKFCTYVSNGLCKECRGLYIDDAYSIYDKIICEILPYYLWKYLNRTDYMGRKHSVISNKLGGSNNDKGDYQQYRSLIDEIREANKNRTGYLISRRDLDFLLWYYFKGDKDICDDNKEFLHKSRITEALEHVINAMR